MQQINEICKVIGTPSKEIIFGYGSTIAWEIFSDPKPRYQKKNWSDIYPHSNAKAQDLLDGMICWDVAKRFDIDRILRHPYLEDIRNKDDEVEMDQTFNFSFEWKVRTLNDMKLLLRDEVENFKAKKHRYDNKFESL